MKISFYNALCCLFIVIFFSCKNNKKVALSTNPIGIGPIKEIKLEIINDSLMKKGKYVFESKCSNCHTMELVNKGPDISDVLASKKPEWVLNFLLNTNEMMAKDTFAVMMVKKFNTKCNPKVSKVEAREILEYLRVYQIWLHEYNALSK